MSTDKFLRYNSDKPMYSLIDFELWGMNTSIKEMIQDYSFINRDDKLISLIKLVNTLRHCEDCYIPEQLLYMKRLAYILSIDYGFYNKSSSQLYLKPFEPLARVLEKGIEKYEINNWKRESDDILHCADSILRHILELQEGKLTDEESGCHHIGHIMANIMFLVYHLDDADSEL
jgi:hypothetical protein